MPTPVKQEKPVVRSDGEVRWQIVEDHLIVLSSHTRCPSHKVCDIQGNEDQEFYVRRHLADHGIPSKNPQTKKAWTYVEARRNLAIACLFYYHKWEQGNMSLLPMPGWEDADFLANGRFTAEDLEMSVPWDQRQFQLKPYDERNVEDAVYKRMRKMTKVRESQKSSWCKAFITWRHLRAFFVENNIYFRVMVISARSALARDNYLEPFSNMWMQHENLVELFGIVGHTKQWREDDPERERFERHTALLDWKKAKIKDGLQLRWNVNSKQNTGQSVTSLFVAGVTTATVGRRWDLIVVDDPCIPENSQTDVQRLKVKRKAAELRKELSAIGELVWLNTPHHLGDASAQIDEKFADEFHILYRPARSGPNGDYRYYWQRDGICSVKANGIACERPKHEHATCSELGTITDHPFLGRVVWDEARIESEERHLDFYSQILLLVRDERHALFNEKDFKKIAAKSCPPEIRYGLGRPVNEDEAAHLATIKHEIKAYNQIDTAGKEKQTTKGDRNVAIGARFDADWNIYVTHVRYGYWSAMQECEEMWESCVRNQPDAFEYEVSGAHEKYVRAAVTDFEARKSIELNRPVSMGINFLNASEGAGSNDSKNKRIERCQPYTSTGRVYILEDAGSEADIALFIREFCEFPWSAHDDGPDAFSRILKRIDAFGYQPAAKPEDAVPVPMFYDEAAGTLTVDAAMWRDSIDGINKGHDWADGGRRDQDEEKWIDNDSIPGTSNRRSAA